MLGFRCVGGGVTAAAAARVWRPHLGAAWMHLGALGAHDVGGCESLANAKLPKEAREMQPWELKMHGLLVLLVEKKLMNVDELRRGVEALPAPKYTR